MSTDILCNLCGLSCVLGCQGSQARGTHGLIEALVVGGYESTPGNGHGALDDLVRYRFSLCEWCLDWLFAQFKIPVAVDDPMNDYLLAEGETAEDGLSRMGMVQVVERERPEPWRPAERRVAEDNWRMDKVGFFEEKKLRDKARAERP